MSKATIIVKQHQDHTTITLKKPTTEINIAPNASFKGLSQDALGRIYMNLRFKEFVQLDDYQRKEK